MRSKQQITHSDHSRRQSIILSVRSYTILERLIFFVAVCIFSNSKNSNSIFFAEHKVSVFLFNYLSSNSLVKSPSSPQKKLALSSLFLSSLSLRLFAASAALSHDALSLSRNLLRSSLSTLYLYLYLSLSPSL